MTGEKGILVTFAGESCSRKDNKCTTWWASTFNNKIVEAEIKLNINDLPKLVRDMPVQKIELVLEDMFKDTKLKLEGVEL